MKLTALCGVSMLLHDGPDALQAGLLLRRRGCVHEIIDRLFGMRKAACLTFGDQGAQNGCASVNVFHARQYAISIAPLPARPTATIQRSGLGPVRFESDGARDYTAAAITTCASSCSRLACERVPFMVAAKRSRMPSSKAVTMVSWT